MSISITRMKKEDLDDVMEIEHLSFAVPWSRESFENEIENNRYACYVVAKQGYKVAGYGGMWLVFDEAHITNIAVHPFYRRRGIGRAILKALIDIAEDNHITSMTLEVRESNIAAQKLYAAFDFKVVGRRKNYYADNREDALLMTRTIIY